MRSTHPATVYYTASDFGREVNRTPSAIVQAANQGRIQVTARTKGGIRLFSKQDVKVFLARCKKLEQETLKMKK
jgi:hypothetical protein